jgi:hypothetical protein
MGARKIGLAFICNFAKMNVPSVVASSSAELVAMRSEEIRQQVLQDDDLPEVAPKPWYEVESDVLEQPWLASATDLLIAWHPEANSLGAPQPVSWNKYFQDAMPKATGTVSIQEQPVTAKEPWDMASASIAVDCLFSFVRALEAMNVDDAMTYVSANYHAMVNDVDIDRDALRLQLDGMIDSWRGPELRVSLSEIPDPIFHLLGILIRITLQVDHRDKGAGERITSLLSYVVWFTEDRENLWLIRSLAVVH